MWQVGEILVVRQLSYEGIVFRLHPLAGRGDPIGDMHLPLPSGVVVHVAAIG